MIPITATDAAGLLAARLIGEATTLLGPDVTIDSRTVVPGALFAAIVGEHNDGHAYAPQAAASGAAAVLVQHEVAVAVPQLVVSDVVAALATLARETVATAKAQGLKVLALTGSSGKTSTKDMLAQIMELSGSTVSPVNSLNNATGMPLTALRVVGDTKFLVSELGANHVGEIAGYTQVAPPDVAAVLNVGLAHLGEFGSREHIAQAKGEIVAPLRPDDWAILNAADPLVTAMAERTRARIGWFGDVNCEEPRSELWVGVRKQTADAFERPSFLLYGRTPTCHFEFPVTLRFAGAHMASNAAAAAAMALAAKVPPETVATGLNAARPRSRWRMELHRLNTGTLIINDAYNANPISVQAAFSVIEKLRAERHRAGESVRVTAVLGDMLELGAESAALHREVGRQAKAAGIDTVIAVGDYAADVVAGAGTAVVASKADVPGLLPYGAADVILLKGSHSVGLEAVADGLIAHFGEADV
ncbi:MAG: UDP-N-acetylmuramoyl-tripeptide--D-alanyl-D-alanine ligase [Propionibacteriaceae bacterium]|jgi:UDP-N-acetylmuramoyl-tripeptide--D-alanyl-D-alanine ligase|nr:UDP-N-acetylmuramoyl-tripeptide--D-alanyl-D-alanine ligase [Propionibacteriaceae bacterium]